MGWVRDDYDFGIPMKVFLVPGSWCHDEGFSIADVPQSAEGIAQTLKSRGLVPSEAVLVRVALDMTRHVVAFWFISEWFARPHEGEHPEVVEFTRSRFDKDMLTPASDSPPEVS